MIHTIPVIILMFHVIYAFKIILSWLRKSIAWFTLQRDDFQNVPFSALESFMKVFVKLSSKTFKLWLLVGSKELFWGACFVLAHTSSLYCVGHSE